MEGASYAIPKFVRKNVKHDSQHLAACCPGPEAILASVDCGWQLGPATSAPHSPAGVRSMVPVESTSTMPPMFAWIGLQLLSAQPFCFELRRSDVAQAQPVKVK